MSSRLPHGATRARTRGRIALLFTAACLALVPIGCRAPQGAPLAGEPYDGPVCADGACNCGMHGGGELAPQYDPAAYGEPDYYDESWAEPAPQPYDVSATWSPPGIDEPYPEDEYLHDGGDADAGVAISPEWEVQGLDVEDTVAHYDSLHGETLVEASNRVHIYAPRFAAVRTVTGAGVHDQVDQLIGVRAGDKPSQASEAAIATTKVQRQQASRQFSAEIANAFRTRQGREALVASLGPDLFDDAFLPYEDFSAIRNGRLDATEKPRLAERMEAAVAWEKHDVVNVLLEGRVAAEMAADQQATAVYTVDDLRNNPKLRLIKVASTQTAKPGDTIDFTLRFDNVGDQPIGNIVIMDKLSTRLKFVPESAQSSVAAAFSSEDNEAASTTLRWEIDKALAPGDGGVVRFRCQVR